MHQRSSVAAWLVLLALAAPAFAWNSTGHTVSAWIAWDHMTPAARAKAVALLKAHPEYERDLLGGMPEGYDDPDRWAFGRAAVWADLIRGKGNPLHNQHHGPWHYINLPIVLGDVVPPAKEPEGEPPHDVVQAIAFNEDLVINATTDAGKAIALCWLLHMVGDVHQPLHAVALFSPQFPEGDKGGNLFVVRRKTGGQTSLHSLWDGLLGGYQAPRLLARVVETATAEFPLERFAAELGVTDPIAWAEESKALAMEYAYAGGKLRGVSSQGRPKDAPPAPMLPADYEEKAKGVARMRVALAGYRLAVMMERLLTVQPSVSSTPSDSASAQTAE